MQPRAVLSVVLALLLGSVGAEAETVCATVVNDVVVGQVRCGETDSTPPTTMDTSDPRWVAHLRPTYQRQYNEAIAAGIRVTGNAAIADTYALDQATQSKVIGIYSGLTQGVGFPGMMFTGSISDGSGNAPGTTLFVTAIQAGGVVSAGSALSDSSGNMAPGTAVTGTLSGTGGIGTYSVSGDPQLVGSELMSVKPAAFPWPSKSGALHSFSPDEFKALAMAMLACVSSYSLPAFQLNNGVFPPQCTVNIP